MDVSDRRLLMCAGAASLASLAAGACALFGWIVRGYLRGGPTW